MFNNNKILVVIPVLGTSDGIPRKHVRLLNNKPLISYSIGIAKASQYVDDVVVTTDDSEIALISEKFGASVIRRSKELSGGDVSLDAVIYDAMVQKEKQAFDEYDIIIIIQPTAPLVKPTTLDSSIEKFEDFDIDTVISIVEDSHLSWGYDSNNQRFFPNYIERLSKDDLPKSFRETGAIVASRRAYIRELSSIGASIDLIELSDEESINIETYADWLVVESYLKKKKVVFVVNANSEIGTRHIYNCLSIASKLITHDFIFVLDEHYTSGIKIVEDFGFPYKIYGGTEELFGILSEFNPHIVVNDILDTSEEYMLRLKNEGYFIVNFDDLGVGAEHANMVFDSLYEHDLSETNVFTGYKYYVLKDEFYFQPSKVITQDVNNVLIFFEGKDSKNLSILFLDAILSTNYQNKINIIFDAGYENIEEFISRYESNPLVQVYQNISNISEFMFKADLIITSASKTMYDACSLAIPTICVCQDELEKTHVFANASNGIINMGLGEELTKQEIVAQFVAIVNNPEIRIEMNNKMKRIDLKHGFENIESVIQDKYVEFEMNK
ncbi:cytidylyltransferase domain-containing protein [Methanobrevibacter sp.]|uniref:cytidylyltransferase domain-containing protein n=1 Tax=Methanobrevibacter sp. TaxID=66852 RepID=UPI00388F7B5B